MNNTVLLYLYGSKQCMKTIDHHTDENEDQQEKPEEYRRPAQSPKRAEDLCKVKRERSHGS